MTRVLKPGCYIILIAPSAGPRHDVIDCWRIMDDGSKAIAPRIGLETVADWIDPSLQMKVICKWRDLAFLLDVNLIIRRIY